MNVFEEGNETTVELKLQDYIEDILKIDNQATILYLFVLIDFQWNPYFPGLNTIEWYKAKWLNFVVLTHLKFIICPPLTFEANTTGRIINDLAIQWIWYRKHYFRICRGEKLKELNWREIEEHKLLEEESPPPMISATNTHCSL
jgi:hypothetical protein